jgi:hypothetical protein
MYLIEDRNEFFKSVVLFQVQGEFTNQLTIFFFDVSDHFRLVAYLALALLSERVQPFGVFPFSGPFFVLESQLQEKEVYYHPVPFHFYVIGRTGNHIEILVDLQQKTKTSCVLVPRFIVDLLIDLLNRVKKVFSRLRRRAL